MKSKAAQADGPVWFDGKNINEALFCDEFLSARKLVFSGGEFFTPDGRVTDDLPLRSEIYDALKCCACNNIPKKISNIIEVLKLSANAEDFRPDAEHIHAANGTLGLDGVFTEGRTEIVRSRLPVAYRPYAPVPEKWLRFLGGLLYPEDIPTLQEYLGYCLIPCTKLTAENAQLAEKSRESAVHRLAEIKLQRDYAEAVAVLERIPPEITAQYGHRKPETAHDR